MNQQCNIIIIDRSGNRKKGMINIFNSIANVYAYDFRSKEVEQESASEPGVWEEIEILPKIDLMLIHPRDRELKDITKAKKRIWYGGNGADDTGVLENEPIINRPILEKDSFLNEKEARQLIAFAMGKIECPACCTEYSQKEKLFDQRHKFLERIQVPTQYDWNQPPPVELFSGFDQEWKKLSEEVKLLLKNDSNLSPFDQKFIQPLKEFIQSTIEKDF